MTVSAISSFSASQTSSYQTYRQAFSQLTSALQSGNLTTAQDAYATLASSPAAQGTGPFAQALQQIGQDLQSGKLSDAQQALASLQQLRQTHSHHHHHAGGGTSIASNSSQTQSDPNAGNSNNDADSSSISIDIQVAGTFDTNSKVDIKA
jgi:soluble cytochrome b562